MMMRFFSIVLLLSIVFQAGAQKTTPEAPLKVAIVAPLSLGSAFNNGLIKNLLPPEMSTYLDFVQGAEIAIDTINTRGKRLEVHILDLQDSVKNLHWLMQYGGLNTMDLIIGNVRPPEFQQLSAFSEKNNIPFVSVIYPNDGGIRKSPHTVIINSTLLTHLNGLYSYVVQKHGMEDILLIKTPEDNRISDFINHVNQQNSNGLLKIRTIETEKLDSARLAGLIDTLKPSVVIGATLNEKHALNIAEACYPFRKNLTLIGMPNWNTFPGLYDREKFKGLAIKMTTPHYIRDNNRFEDYLANQYFTKYRTRPSDVAEKGFESAYFFINLLLRQPSGFWDSINDRQYASLHTYHFRKVSFEKDGQTDYYENNHLFMIQLLDGSITQVN